MDGGMENPLGARALYLFQDKKDTLFRIHGTNEPNSIGKAVSSGCIRMLNSDVIDLYGGSRRERPSWCFEPSPGAPREGRSRLSPPR